MREAAAIFGNTGLTGVNGLNGFIWRGQPVIITGIGKTNAAISLTHFLSKPGYKGTTPLLLGIAGAYRSSGVQIGDICTVQWDYFVDEAEFDGAKLRGISVCDGNRARFAPYGHDLAVCDANTVSMLAGTDEIAEVYRSESGAAIESMEGAAFAAAAAKYGVEAMQVRAVSNYCGAKETRQWNPKPALEKLKEFVNTLL